MDTGLFDLAEAQEHPLWAQELFHFADHTPETEEYGIISFVYRAKDPFDPAKLHAFFNEPWEGVVRAKGFFWLATRPDHVGEMSQAGAMVRYEGLGRWWAAIPKEHWPTLPEFEEILKRHWSEDYGDRRQEIVFIGLKGAMDEAKLPARLDKCLAADYLAVPQKYASANDPFPQWFQQAA